MKNPSQKKSCSTCRKPSSSYALSKPGFQVPKPSLVVHNYRNWLQNEIITNFCAIYSINLFRWLAQNNREDEAVKTLITMAKVNRRNLTDQDKDKIEKMIKEIALESHMTEDSLSFLDMFRHGNLLKTLNLFFAWTMACVSFYAISFASADLSGNIILNYLLSKLVQIPENGLTAWFINLLGRKKTLVVSHIFLGICCLALSGIPKEYSNLILVIYLLASMSAGISE